MNDSVKDLQERINYKFCNLELLEQALTHSSLDTPLGNNQRLEFLGDSVLDLIVAEQLLKNDFSHNEGALDRMRAGIVNGKALAKMARKIGLDRALRVSDAQRKHHPEHTDNMLEDALEALIGAIYLDGGLSEIYLIVLALFDSALKNCDPTLARDPKSQLQEWSQLAYQGVTPEYRELPAEGPDHARIYHASVYIVNKKFGRGSGSTKKAAEQAAAKAALQALKLD